MLRQRGDAEQAPFGQLLDGARRRDPASLRQLHDSVVRQVAAYFRTSGCVDPSGSTNEVMFRALTNLHAFEGAEDRFRAWVLTIAHHLLIDERRARSRRPPEVALPEDADWIAGDDVASVAEAADGTDRVLAMLADLPESQREVIALRWVGGLSLAEVAEVLECKVGAVKALQHRGVTTLRERHVSRTVDLTFTQT